MAQKENNAANALEKVDRQFFIENKGQWDEEVLFLTRLNGLDAWITKSGVSYDYYNIQKSPQKKLDEFKETKESSQLIERHLVRLKMIDYNPEMLAKGNDKCTGHINYLIGNDKNKWATNVAMYKEVTIKDVFKDIDEKYYFDKGNIRYDYIVKPNANIENIKFSFEGVDKSYVNNDGDLVYSTRFGEVKQAKLYTYQEIKGKRVEVKSNFQINDNGQIGFDVSNYNKNTILIIDPLVYSTFIGGRDAERGVDIDVDATGHAYIAGGTWSAIFPGAATAAGGFSQSFSGYTDGFVLKLNTNGTDVDYWTYIGGNGYDWFNSIELDQVTNKLYIVGESFAPDFPTLSSANTPYKSSITTLPATPPIAITDAVVCILNASGTSLDYCSFIGQTSDNGMDIKIDPFSTTILKRFYITGYTSPVGAPTIFYPVTTGSCYTTYNMTTEVFISKMDPNTGTAGLINSTYLGGSNESDWSTSIDVDHLGWVYVGGITQSSNFPVTTGTYQGGRDAFVVKVSSDLSCPMVYSSIFGTSSNDEAHEIKVNKTGNNLTYVVGTAGNSNYPNLLNGASVIYQFGGGTDVFVTALGNTGNLVHSRIIGGYGVDEGFGLSLDAGNVYITGLSASVGSTIPTTSAPFYFPTTECSFNPIGYGLDAFVTELSLDLGIIIYSTMIGGQYTDAGFGIKAIGNDVYLTGLTRGEVISTPSQLFPVTPTAFDPTFNGVGTTTGGIDEDAFVTKLALQHGFCCSPSGQNLYYDPLTLKLYQTNVTTFIPAGSLAGTAGNLKKVYINGTFTINANMNFNYCHIYFTPNSKIVLDPTKTLTITNSILETPDGCPMWDGIYAENANNSLTVTDCRVEDMINGFVQKNGANSFILRNNFQENRISLQYIFTPIGSLVEVKANEFKSSGLKAPFTGQLGQHGILMHKTRMPIIGDATGVTRNQFSSLKNGIAHYEGNSPASSPFGFRSTYNKFVNIVGGPQIFDQLNPGAPSLYQSYEGCCIYMDNNSIVSTLNLGASLISDHDEFVGAPNYLFGNSKAIVTGNVSSEITDADVLHMQCGFMHTNTNGCFYKIQRNHLSDINYGMQFVGNSGNGSLIQDNTIELRSASIPYAQAMGLYSPGSPTPTYVYVPAVLWPVGIDIQQVNKNYTSNFFIGGTNTNPYHSGFSNYINVTTNSGYGIKMNNAGAGFKVDQNKVLFTNADATNCGGIASVVNSCAGLHGMYASNCQGSRFSGNHISSNQVYNGSTFNARASNGMYIQDSKGLLLECNTVKTTHHGFQARGNCNTGSEYIRGNRFENHRLAWLFRSYTANPGGFGLNIGNASTATYKDNNNLFTGSYFNYTGGGQASSPTKVLRLTFTGDITPRYIYINPNNPTTFPATNIIQNESKSNISGGKYTVVFDVYPFFNTCTAPIAPPSELEDAGLTDGEAMDIVEGDMQYPLFNEVGQYVDRMYLYSLLENNLTLLNSEPAFGTFYTEQSNANLGHIYAVEQLMAYLADSTALRDSILFDSLLVIINATLQDINNNGNEYENCERWIEEQYYAYISQGVLGITAADKINIALLANSCPASVGPCVYTARSLNAMLNPGMQYNDDALCAAALPPNKNGTNPYQNELDFLNSGQFNSNIANALLNNELVIYPNPNNAGGQLFVAYNLHGGEHGQLLIHDMVGQIVQKVDLSKDINSINFNLDRTLSAGTYKVTLWQGNKLLATKKLSVGN